MSSGQSMRTESYTVSYTVDQSPQKVFNAINNVRGRWSGEISGRTDKLGAEFTYRYQDLHRSTQKITELVPGQEGRLARPGRKDQFRRGQERMERQRHCLRNHP